MTIEKEILDSATVAEMFDFYHLMPEGDIKVMTELDLLLTLDQYKKLYKSSERPKRKAANNITQLWPDCTVYYEIMGSLNSPNERQVIKDAISEWEKFTCLRFKTSTTNPSRIQFQDGAGCYSQLGMQTTPQPIALARGCRTRWVVAHEIGHAVGWYHEHMRPDRDEYIQVNWAAIPLRFQENYIQYSVDVINTYNVGYDYESVMHYGATAIPNSITALDDKYQDKMGQRVGFSFKDIKLANLMYNCSENNKCKPLKCPHNGFVLSNTYKGHPGCQCWCDSGNLTDPLILCSTLNKERPTPVPIEPTQTPEVPKPPCLDVRTDCKERKSKGECMSKLELMMDLCAKTCQFCVKGASLCMDHDKAGRLTAAAGLCEDEGLKSFMKRMCPASCGHCVDISDPCAIHQEMMGFELSEASSLRKNLCCFWIIIMYVDSMTIEKEILDSATVAEMFDFYHLMPEGDIKVMTELDLLLTLDQYKTLYKSSERPKRKAANNITQLWPDCTVYYEIMGSLNSQNERQVIKDAISEWEKFTCLRFKTSTTNPSRIQFQDGAGCYSQLGMQATPQPIALARGCRTRWVVAHEIGHAVGWYHEHMRPDRDQYIQVNWVAIPLRFQENYIQYSVDVINTYNVGYDYESVMHYGATAIPNSLTALDDKYQDKMGQRVGFSFKDIKLANLMYNCSENNKCKSDKCPHNGFVLSNTYKGQPGCQCWCDSGNLTDPLILCSRLKKERPTPVPKRPTPVPKRSTPVPKRPTLVPIEPTQIPEVPKPPCLDVRTDCKERKSKGECMSKLELMMDLCAKTCQFCGKGASLCMDHDKACRLTAASGLCEDEGSKSLMKRMCPASCGHCVDISDPCTIHQEMMGSVNSEAWSLRRNIECYFLIPLVVCIHIFLVRCWF
ncbi:hypothetical protein Btru_078067 [Bulinus truncatus]|nr:hypothetical protein Btru_078067 [Bulinus truncatus]